MELQKLLTADYLDIVFDARNKKYGGYELRRHYNRRMTKALVCLTAFISALAGLSFINAPKPDDQRRIFDRETVVSSIDIPIEQPKVIVPPTPPQPKPSSPVRAKLFTDIVITNEPIPVDKQMANNKDLTHAAVGSFNAEGDSASVDIAPTKAGNNKTGVVSTITSVGPVRIVDQMPRFAGDIGVYIASHLNYPEEARATGIEGRVVVEFVVDEEGKVTHPKVVRSIGGGCDEEALRMVSGMPAWKPGKQSGIPVKVYFSLPIKFELH